MPEVVALFLNCDACGSRVRIAHDDEQSFHKFCGSHKLPVLDGVEVLDDDGTAHLVVIDVQLIWERP